MMNLGYKRHLDRFLRRKNNKNNTIFCNQDNISKYLLRRFFVTFQKLLILYIITVFSYY